MTLLTEIELKLNKCSVAKQNIIRIKQLVSYSNALIIPNWLYYPDKIPIKISRECSIIVTKVSQRFKSIYIYIYLYILIRTRDNIQIDTNVFTKTQPSRKKITNLLLTICPLLHNIGTSLKRVGGRVIYAPSSIRKRDGSAEYWASYSRRKSYPEAAP